MKCSQIFILIPCVVLVGLMSACDRPNNQTTQDIVDTIQSPVNPPHVDSFPDEEYCLDDDHTIGLATSSSTSRLGSTVALSCPINY